MKTVKSFDPLYGSVPENPWIVPVIPNIHQAVLEVVSAPLALNMSFWHTCETIHCRAGWVINLAGEAGKALERRTCTLFAALQIYKASSSIKVSELRFFDGEHDALRDIKRCAKKEKELNDKIQNNKSLK